MAKVKFQNKKLKERFMLAACLLLSKGYLINQNVLSSIKMEYNNFELPEFKNFIKMAK